MASCTNTPPAPNFLYTHLHSSDGFEAVFSGGSDGVNQYKVPPHLNVESRMLLHVHLKLLNSRAGSLGWHLLSVRYQGILFYLGSGGRTWWAAWVADHAGWINGSWLRSGAGEGNSRVGWSGGCVKIKCDQWHIVVVREGYVRYPFREVAVSATSGAREQIWYVIHAVCISIIMYENLNI